MFDRSDIKNNIKPFSILETIGYEDLENYEGKSIEIMCNRESCVCIKGLYYEPE